ncbi:unannotated protein [freshwater metagenome]|uniref:Unannotated protein n=1 Tax=freshwater metagenome TaxID=449393 RepID=A0A6J5ZMI7_9ZZZZ
MRNYLRYFSLFFVSLLIVIGIFAVRSEPGNLGTAPSADIPSRNPSGATSGSPVELEKFYSQQLSWSDCNGGFDCATLKVPRDYANPNIANIEIAVIRLKSDGAQASLLLNPGGPGGSGIDYVRAATYVTSKALRKNFDIVGFDPRGVGKSTPIDCLDDKQTDQYIAADGSPDDQVEIDQTVQILETFAAECAKNSPQLYAHVDTVSATRDIDILRAALGDTKLNWLGKSYGTLLGATYASLFPQNVGRMLLDGAIDPKLSNEEMSLGQALGFEDALDRFVADCPSHKDCPLNSDPIAARAQIQGMLDNLDANPSKLADGRSFTQAMGVTGVFGSLYDKAYSWPEFRQSLSDALEGDFEMLAESVDFYTGRNSDGSYSDNSNDAIAAVNCLDRPDRATVEQTKSLAAQWRLLAPTFGEYLAWSNVGCTFWKTPATGSPGKISAEGAPTILVVGTTHDPATPYEWAQSLAEQLSSGVLLTLDGDGHTAYLQGSPCIDQVVDKYYLTGKVDNGITCSDQS